MSLTDVTAATLLILAFVALPIWAAVAVIRRRRIVAIVYPWDTALLYRDGIFRRELPSGRHVFYGIASRILVVTVPASEQLLRFGQMDVITSDRFAFRIQLSLAYRYADPRGAYEAKVFSGYGDANGLFERVAAVALAVVGTRDLDTVVAAPAAIATDVAAAIGDTLPFVEVVSVMLTKLDLPPETRRMLTEVERARRDGLAALERARAEQASLRALANAARLVKDNPELAQLRLLKTIEDAKGSTTIVLGDPRTTRV